MATKDLQNVESDNNAALGGEVGPNASQPPPPRDIISYFLALSLTEASFILRRMANALCQVLSKAEIGERNEQTTI
ncbi:hypothetical protein RR48_11697 [Papilio machaon]|uniref:Uncharacterized protein n=1 Tax=Papilio machaon TaxID=76193 RepID=A0A194QNU9_PAPMA|nr:hypothetical protein RR48_11697 [Papilio machaon]